MLSVSMAQSLLTMLEQVISLNGWLVFRVEDGVAGPKDSAKLCKIAIKGVKLTMEAHQNILKLLTIGTAC